MSRRLIKVSRGGSVYEAVKLMVQNNISGVVVEDGGKAVGVLTMRDVVGRVVAEGRDVYGTSAGEVMSSPALTVNQLLTVEKAAAIMGERKVKRLVVVDELNRARGVVTAMDVVSNLPCLLDVMFKTWVKPDWR